MEVTNPAKGQTWELREKPATEGKEGPYVFVLVAGVHDWRDTIKVSFSPFNLETGCRYRLMLDEPLKKFTTLYQQKVGPSYWSGRVIKMPEFTTIPYSVLTAMKHRITSDNLTSDDPLKTLSEDLTNHFDSKQIEYETLKQRVMELGTDLTRYKEFMCVL